MSNRKLPRNFAAARGATIMIHPAPVRRRGTGRNREVLNFADPEVRVSQASRALARRRAANKTARAARKVSRR